MRIVFDENVPRPLFQFFDASHQVKTVADLGLSGATNGALLAHLDGSFDVFLTADKNLRYQQNLTERSLAVWNCQRIGYRFFCLDPPKSFPPCYPPLRVRILRSHCLSCRYVRDASLE